MATPRCLRPFLAPSKRMKISPSSRTCLPSTPGFARRQNSVKTSNDGEGSKILDERLTDIGIDPMRYRTIENSVRRAAREEDRLEPKTPEEMEEQLKVMREQPDHNMLLHVWKRAGVEPIKLAKERGISLPGDDKAPVDPETQKVLDELRAPVNVQAIHLRPFRRTPGYGVPVCDLQLRTYSIRNLLLFADFAVRAAYYMGLCARGPVPLPRITERWTVPRANFVFKKSQENFERVTMRRLIQIQDGHPDVVKAWLAFLRKHQYHGVGMKANIWEYEDLEAATRAGYEIEEGDYSRRREGPIMEKVEEILNRKGYKEAMKEHKSDNGVELRF